MLQRLTPLPIVLVAGNPNSGKSTLFNALTGARAHVANYPGVTIDRVSATLAADDGSAFELVDLPGTYGLSARSREEQIAVDALIGHGLPAPQAVVVVVDAATLGRSLFLAIEVIATGVPVVIALNMSDEAARDGITIDVNRLQSMTGATVVRTVATKGEGLAELKAAIAQATTRPASDAPSIERPTALAVDIAELEAAILAEHALDRPAAARAWATWLMLSLDDDGADDLAGVPPPLRALTRAIRSRAAAEGRNVDLEIIASSYRRVDAIVESVVRRARPSRRLTDRIDAVLTHGVYGGAVFALVMLVVFQALFTWSEPAIALIESMVAGVQGLASSTLPPGPLTDLMINGIIAGVGNVVVFVPQIGLLFLFIGLLEDSGYLARVAFVIDRLMRSVGLNGRAFVPMLSGFSCAIPAVMATRTIENRTDRLLTMLVLPLMSCSARLPVYVLITATIFAPDTRFGFLSVGAVVLFSMYMLSVVAALTAAAVLRRTVLKGPGSPLVLELPPYRLPAPGVLFFNVWQRVRSFLAGAGTVILALTIVLWALLSYPKAATDAAGDQLRQSFAGRLGHVIEPAIEPLGFDWRIGVGIIGAFAAREVFVSTLAIVFDIESDGEEDQPLREALRTATWPDGRPLMTPLAGVSLMVFFVLACQCMSTVAVVRRESGTWRWPLFMVAYMTLLAYGASLIVYQVGARLGLGLG